MQVKKLKDDNGCLYQVYKTLPFDYYEKFLKAIAELEDKANHIRHTFPLTELHKVRGTTKSVYRAYIDKTSGWRLHVQYGENEYLLLIEVLPPSEHDDASRVIKTRKGKYK